MAYHKIEALSFQDLAEGDEWESLRRTVTEADVVNFAGLSGDFNPIHMDHPLAKSGPFGKPIAHGLLGLAIASGLGTNAPRVDTMALLSIVEWKFAEPIAFGDTLHLVTRVASLEAKANGRRGIVTWHRKLLNQDGAIVQEGTTRTLVRGKTGRDPAAG